MRILIWKAKSPGGVTKRDKRNKKFVKYFNGLKIYLVLLIFLGLLRVCPWGSRLIAQGEFMGEK
jgi:hypothetical protein